jgi:hypothetical protein
MVGEKPVEKIEETFGEMIVKSTQETTNDVEVAIPITEFCSNGIF